MKKFEELHSNEKGVWKYSKLIPFPSGYEKITLNEGSTPFVKIKAAERLGYRNVYAKLEGSNPTGSFKDRGMAVAISAAKMLGAKIVISASTGNTAASMSAYARRAGILPAIMIPKGKVALGKMSQLALYGAYIVEVDGNFDDAMSEVIKISQSSSTVYVMNSVNPWRLEGQKTVIFEIIEELRNLDWIVLPLGNGGNTTAIWKGIKELREAGILSETPKILAVQAEGASPIVKALRTGKFEPELHPETIASAIRIGKPVHWERVISALKESKGVALSVSDDEIIGAQRELARFDGIGVEAASAAAYAGFKKAIEQGLIGRDEKVAIILTGHALKEGEALTERYRLEKVDSLFAILKDKV